MDEKTVEEVFSSDEEFCEDEENSETDTDVDAKVAEDEVFDLEFFKCYAALKKKDAKIYDQNTKFFTDEVSDEEEHELVGEGSPELDKKSKKTPRMTLLDHQINLKEEDLEDLEELKREPKIDLNKPVSKSFYEKELEEIKRSIEKVGEGINSDEDDDLLVVKSGNSKISPEVGSQKRINAMLDKIEHDEDEEIEHLKELWNDPSKLTEEEKYLRDYILNKRYISSQIEAEEVKNAAHFSKNLEELSDIEEEEGGDEKVKKKINVDHHSEEKDFDKIARVPRNSTNTIRDLVEKQTKKEKRSKKMEKEKKKKKALKEADFEDIVGDTPIKFQYRETEPNDYGLSAEELLMATDEELDRWVSLRDTIAYKSREEELREKSKFDQKRHDHELKKKIFKSIYDGKSQTLLPTEPQSNQRKRKSRDDEGAVEADLEPVEDKQRKKKTKRRGLNHKKFAKSGVAPDRLLAYGLSKTKLKKSKLL